MTKNIQTRLVTKHAKEAEWKTSDLIILNGELIIYDSDETHSYSRVKIGNGISRAEELPFIDESILDQVDFSYDYNDLINAPIIKDNSGSLIEADSNKKIATEEYVSEQIANISIETPGEYTSIILKSSTEGSNKKFRLTIDDDGVISTEEVTE